MSSNRPRTFSVLAGTLPLVLSLVLFPLALRSAAPPRVALVSGLSGSGELRLHRDGKSEAVVTGMHLLRGDMLEGKGGATSVTLLDLASGGLVSQTLDGGTRRDVSALLSGEKPSVLSRLYRGVARLFEGDEEAVGRVGGAQAGLMHDPTLESDEEMPSPCPPPPPSLSRAKKKDYERPSPSFSSSAKRLQSDLSSLDEANETRGIPDDEQKSFESDSFSDSEPEDSARLERSKRRATAPISDVLSAGGGAPAPQTAGDGEVLLRKAPRPDLSVRSFDGLVKVRTGSGRVLPLARLHFLHRPSRAEEGRPFLALHRIRDGQETPLPRVEMTRRKPGAHVDVDLRQHAFLVGDVLRWEVRSYEGALLEGPFRAGIVSPASWVPVVQIEKEARKAKGAMRQAMLLLASQSWERLGELRRAALLLRVLARDPACSPRDRGTFRERAAELVKRSRGDEAR